MMQLRRNKRPHAGLQQDSVLKIRTELAKHFELRGDLEAWVGIIFGRELYPSKMSHLRGAVLRCIEHHEARSLSLATFLKHLDVTIHADIKHQLNAALVAQQSKPELADFTPTISQLNRSPELQAEFWVNPETQEVQHWWELVCDRFGEPAARAELRELSAGTQKTPFEQVRAEMFELAKGLLSEGRRWEGEVLSESDPVSQLVEAATEATSKPPSTPQSPQEPRSAQKKPEGRVRLAPSPQNGLETIYGAQGVGEVRPTIPDSVSEMVPSGSAISETPGIIPMPDDFFPPAWGESS